MLIGLAVMILRAAGDQHLPGAWPRFAIWAAFCRCSRSTARWRDRDFDLLAHAGQGGTSRFVTGNLGNLKVPCALNAMQIAGVKPATKEGEVISTLAVAASSLVTNVMLIIGVLLLAQLRPSWSPPPGPGLPNPSCRRSSAP